MTRIITCLLLAGILSGCAAHDSGKEQSGQISYTGDHLRHVLFPIGGIGTGNLLLGGRGEIHELEFFNIAHRDELRPYMTFFSLWAREEGSEPVKRIMEREHLDDFPNGFGVPRQQLAGIPRFREVVFNGQYPIALLKFSDPDVPVTATLEAFNPFIPLDISNSSLPVAILKWTITNTSKKTVDFSVCMNMGSPMNNLNYRQGNLTNHPTRNEFFQSEELQGVLMSNTLDTEHHEYGNVAMFTTAQQVDVQTGWYKGSWWDNSQIFWNDFSDDGRLESISEKTESQGRQTDVASLLVPKTLKPGESVEIPFYISWHVPNRLVESSQAFGNETVANAVVKNHYALGFEDSREVASYVVKHLDYLETSTKKFHERISQSTFPKYVIDAVSSNLAILKTNVFMRTGDGHYHGFEGIGLDFGCCPGNCTHVFNYAQTIASLFPSIERDMRETAFLYETYDNGYQSFRTVFPVCDCAFKNVATDGQMGNIMRVYREWKYSGDTEWLSLLWPKVKLALEFAWKGSGELVSDYPWMSNALIPWDPQKEGIMRGEQHNTYDINFFGPNMMTGSLYLGALRACAEMAAVMKEPDKAIEYLTLYKLGAKKYDDLLWNGSYYKQLVEIAEGIQVSERMKSLGTDIPKYQFGNGCLSDQLLGQYLAFVSGMGYILDQPKVDKALESIYKYNFVESFRNFENIQRVYALNDESGLVICTWPEGDREAIPFPYADEVWTGVEYQVAASLIYAGMPVKGLKIVEAIRERYNGANRNPYAEIESGFYYVRAMASWSVLMALSGFSHDGIEKSLTFNPETKLKHFQTFWSTGSAWGNFFQNKNGTVLEVDYGNQVLKELTVPQEHMDRIMLNDLEIRFTRVGNTLIFEEEISISPGDTLYINA